MGASKGYRMLTIFPFRKKVLNPFLQLSLTFVGVSLIKRAEDLNSMIESLGKRIQCFNASEFWARVEDAVLQRVLSHELISDEFTLAFPFFTQSMISRSTQNVTVSVSDEDEFFAPDMAHG